MHILVTAATDIVGRLAARQLIAAGHTVTGISEHAHPCLDPGVEFVQAPLSDPVLGALADEADAVVHLAPIEMDAPQGAGIDGVTRVTDAAARAGARLLYVSQAAGRPDLYGPAETMVSSGWGQSLVVRAAPLVGRQLDWAVCRTVATLLRTRISARPLHLLHVDDLVRFLIAAVATDRTGSVDLATPDTTNVITAWRLLRAAAPGSQPRHAARWPQLIPDMDPSALQEDWDFDFGWHAVDAVTDTGRGLVGRRLSAAGAVSHGRQLELPVEAVPRPHELLASAAPEGLEGEFDDRIDPRFPVFSASFLDEALPGPLTPITLDVQLTGLRTASRVVGELLALGGVITDEWGSRGIAVFGHRAYVGVSANVVAAGQLLGWDPRAVTRNALGPESQMTELLPLGPPQLASGPLGSIAKALVAARSLAVLRNLRRDTAAYADAAAAEHLDAEKLAGLTDATLEVRIRLLRDRIHQGWILTALWVIDEGVTAAALEHAKAGTRVAGVGVVVQSDRTAALTASLAAALLADPTLHALAREGNVTALRAMSPDTAAAVDDAIAQVGHRGPGECELARTMFGDDPAQLLIAAAKLSPPVRELPAPRTFTQRWAANSRSSRELAHDITMLFTHELRITLRELGSRRVTADLIDVVDDVYYLTCDELVTMPADARLRIKRRRAERDRFQAQRPPDVIDKAWTPVAKESDGPRPGD